VRCDPLPSFIFLTGEHRSRILRAIADIFRNNGNDQSPSVSTDSRSSDMDPYFVAILHHRLWRTLLRGSSSEPRRPALPPELVDLIFREAFIVTPDHDLTIASTKAIHVHANDGTIQAQIWFKSHTLTVARTAAVQLATFAHDQGHCSQPEHGSYSWFELGVVAGDEESNDVAGVADNVDVRWMRSHCNLLATHACTHLEGPVFSAAELGLREGGRIAVRACCQYGAWANYAQNGRLRVLKWFEPVVEM
jgi:hypothetical protein